MIKITFPDGSVREFAKGTTAFQIAESISPRLAADSLAASVNGATVDMMRPIEEDASVKFYKWEDEEGKHAFWHTSSHLLAEASRHSTRASSSVSARPSKTASTTTSIRRRRSPSRPAQNRAEDAGAFP